MPIHSLMDLVVVVMVDRGGGKRGKVGWMVIRVGEGGVGVQERVRLAESWCESFFLSPNVNIWVKERRFFLGG